MPILSSITSLFSGQPASSSASKQRAYVSAGDAFALPATERGRTPSSFGLQEDTTLSSPGPSRRGSDPYTVYPPVRSRESYRPSSNSYPALTHTLHRLRRILIDPFPEVLETLNPPCSQHLLAAFESELRSPLPPPVRDLYLLHDGQDSGFGSGSSPSGLFFGLHFLPLEEVMREWAFWRRTENDPSTGANPAVLATMASIPPKWIKGQYACRGWIPLLSDRSGNYVGVDLEPGDGGAWGQVILFGREYDRKCVLWRGEGEGGWGKWLAGFVDDLESGEGWDRDGLNGSGGNSSRTSPNSSDNEEDEIGYSSYSGGGASGEEGRGMKIGGEYKGWNVLEAWWDRSVRKWEEIGMGMDVDEIERGLEEARRLRGEVEDGTPAGGGGGADDPKREGGQEGPGSAGTRAGLGLGMGMREAGRGITVEIPVIPSPRPRLSTPLIANIVHPFDPSTPITADTDTLISPWSPDADQKSPIPRIDIETSEQDKGFSTPNPRTRQMRASWLGQQVQGPPGSGTRRASGRIITPISTNVHPLSPHADPNDPNATDSQNTPTEQDPGFLSPLQAASSRLYNSQPHANSSSLASPYTATSGAGSSSTQTHRLQRRTSAPPPVAALDLPTRADVQAAVAIASVEQQRLRGGWIMGTGAGAGAGSGAGMPQSPYSPGQGDQAGRGLMGRTLSAGLGGLGGVGGIVRRSFDSSFPYRTNPGSPGGSTGLGGNEGDMGMVDIDLEGGKGDRISRGSPRLGLGMTPEEEQQQREEEKLSHAGVEHRRPSSALSSRTSSQASIGVGSGVGAGARTSSALSREVSRDGAGGPPALAPALSPSVTGVPIPGLDRSTVYSGASAQGQPQSPHVDPLSNQTPRASGTGSGGPISLPDTLRQASESLRRPPLAANGTGSSAREREREDEPVLRSGSPASGGVAMAWDYSAGGGRSPLQPQGGAHARPMIRTGSYSSAGSGSGQQGYDHIGLGGPVGQGGGRRRMQRESSAVSAVSADSHDGLLDSPGLGRSGGGGTVAYPDMTARAGGGSQASSRAGSRRSSMLGSPEAYSPSLGGGGGGTEVEVTRGGTIKLASSAAQGQGHGHRKSGSLDKAMREINLQRDQAASGQAGQAGQQGRVGQAGGAMVDVAL